VKGAVVCSGRAVVPCAAGVEAWCPIRPSPDCPKRNSSVSVWEKGAAGTKGAGEAREVVEEAGRRNGCSGMCGRWWKKPSEVVGRKAPLSGV